MFDIAFFPCDHHLEIKS